MERRGNLLTFVFDLLIKSCTKKKENVNSKRGFSGINTDKPNNFITQIDDETGRITQTELS